MVNQVAEWYNLSKAGGAALVTAIKALQQDQGVKVSISYNLTYNGQVKALMTNLGASQGTPGNYDAVLVLTKDRETIEAAIKTAIDAIDDGRPVDHAQWVDQYGNRALLYWW